MAKASKRFDTAFSTYTSISVLGEGGAGRVYLTEDPDGKSYAIKVLITDRATSEKLKRFKNEIEFCRRNSHPNILSVVDFGLFGSENKKEPFCVMPFFPSTLRKAMTSDVAPEQVLRVFSKMLDGVETAHLLKVVHRDLKPENILLDPKQDQVVIADFGIAHFEEELLATAVETQDSNRLANFLYAAPEQRIRGGRIDHRCDIFALGLMLNEMFTGSVPQGEGYAKIASQHSNYAYLDDIVAQMIQHSPEARPSSIEMVKRLLIGHKNEFVALQELDTKRQQVVPALEANQFDPLSIVSVDWNDGLLILLLNRIPPNGWINHFATPRDTYSFIQGAGPAQFSFNGNQASVAVNEGSAQRVLDNAKSYVEIANRTYSRGIDHAKAEEQRKKREALERETRTAQARTRILKELKL